MNLCCQQGAHGRLAVRDDAGLFFFFSSSAAGEKRKPSEPLPHEENKRPRVVGDIPVDLINEVMATIADPAAVPEVSQRSSPRRRCSLAKHKRKPIRETNQHQFSCFKSD